MRTKVLVVIYIVFCLLIIVLTSIGIFIIHNGNSFSSDTDEGRYYITVSVVIAVISAGSTPLAFLANRVYDELTDGGHYYLWGIAYGLTVLIHIPCFFTYNHVYGIVQMFAAIFNLAFPFVFWPIAAIVRVHRNRKYLHHKKNTKTIDGGMD